MRWEYHTEVFEPDMGFFSMGGKIEPEQINARLNELGDQGWELTSCFDTSYAQGATRRVVCILKRPRG